MSTSARAFTMFGLYGMFAAQIGGAAVLVFGVALSDEMFAWAVMILVFGVVGILFAYGFDRELANHVMTRKEAALYVEGRDLLSWFIRQVVDHEAVERAFILKSTKFDEASRAQIRFYSERDAELADISKRNPDDPEMTEYCNRRSEFEPEEERFKGIVSNKKDEFWHFYSVVGRVNGICSRHDDGLIFVRPKGIKDSPTAIEKEVPVEA